MNDVDFPVAKVLEGIEEADRVGSKPLKMNMVVKRGTNDQSVVDMARYFKGSGHILRFIEFMDVGHTNGWKMEHVVPSRELVARINARIADRAGRSELRRRGRRALALQGRLRRNRLHLFGHPGVLQGLYARAALRRRLASIPACSPPQGTDLRGLIRGGAIDEEISAAIAKVWRARADRYSEIRTDETAKLRKVEMSYIGG